jgi:2-amino-1-hydroxyethylphosphonate dioxygenase (glycine-forming)
MDAASVDRLLALLEGAQGAYFGEPVTQLAHALQCAALAHDSGSHDDLILAALLHDVGHLLADPGDFGVPDHDQLGATFLESLNVHPRIVELVRGHVQAKRYLTAVRPEYYERLSDASKQTLASQGGPMSTSEVVDFDQDPLRIEKLRLRAWDEAAKIPGLAVPPLDSYRPLLLRD